MFTSRRSLAALAALTVPMLLASACSTSVTGVPSGERADYAAARERWRSRNVDSYSWVYQRGSCECLPEWTRPLYVEVNGASVIVLDDATRQPPTYLALSTPPTVDYLFDVIAAAIAQDAYRLHVEYDPVYGHPRVVDVDYHEQYVDDEMRVETRAFVPR